MLINAKGQNLLTVFTAFVVWWWSLGCLRFAFNGLFQSMLNGYLGIIITLLLVFIYFMARSRYSDLFKNRDSKQAIYFLAITLSIYILSFVIGGKLIPGDFVIMAFIGWAILSFEEDTRMKTFDAFLSFTITLLFLSLIEFLIYSIIGQGIIVGIVERHFSTGGSQVFIQTLFNFILMDNEIPRFQSLYEEPGGLGNVSILLIFLTGNNPKYRFSHIVAWIAGIMSFSLGFYFLAFIYLLGQKIKLKYCFALIAFIIAFSQTQFLMERFDVLIAHRLEDRSLDEIDNRSNEMLDTALAQSISDGTIWFGHGGALPDLFQYESGVSGAKPFIYKYGFIMTLVVISFYIRILTKLSSRYKLSRRKQFLFILFFFFSFYKSALLFQPFFILMFFLYPYTQCLAQNHLVDSSRSLTKFGIKNK